MGGSAINSDSILDEFVAGGIKSVLLLSQYVVQSDPPESSMHVHTIVSNLVHAAWYLVSCSKLYKSVN